MRLTENILQAADSRVGELGRTLELRDYGISALEAMSVVGDIHDTLDISNNELRVLGISVVLIKTRTVLLAKNRVVKIQDDIGQYLPQLETLSLAKNLLSSLSDLEPLKTLKHLTNLVLIENPVAQKEHYRLFVIWLIPHLRILDFKKVKAIERSQAGELFGTFEKPTEIAQVILKHSTSFVHEQSKESLQVQNVLRKLTKEETEALKTQLKNATSLDEIDRIENALKNGYI